MVSRYDSLEERFHQKYIPEPNSGCWLWIGRVQSDGYGEIMDQCKILKAHRVSYELHIGPIPNGLQIDHLCCVRCCVNPHHLEAVTSGENTRRGDTGKNMSSKTHCPRGHEYTFENTYVQPNGSRYCKECRKINQKRYRDTLTLGKQPKTR